MASTLRVTDLSFSYGAKLILKDISLHLQSGESTVVLGPSGIGKSTLLKLIGGVLSPSSGTIDVENCSNIVSRLVFQEPRLFPWLSVRGNIEFALRAAQVPSDQWPARMNPLLQEVGLADETERSVRELSIGMAQRVSLVRALCCRPSILLLDEPFSAIDPQRRRQLQQELLRLKVVTQVAIVMVTHDIQEAVTIGDHIVVLRGTPGQVAMRMNRNADPEKTAAGLVRALMGNDGS